MRNFIFSLLAFAPLLAHSYTQCQVNIDSIYAGDGGAVIISYVSGGSAVIGATDPNRMSALSVALSAFAIGKPIVVRYNSDNVSCTANLVNDFRGLTILRN